MSNARYTIFAARAVFDARLTHADKVVLAALGSYTNGEGWCFPSQKTLCERIGVARSTLCAALKKLAKHGYIAVRPRTAKGRGKVGNEYRVLTDLPPMSAQLDNGEKPMSDSVDIGPQAIDLPPMSDGAENGANVRLAGRPLSDGLDIATKEVTSPSERAQSSPTSNEVEEDLVRSKQRAAYEAAAQAKADAKSKPKPKPRAAKPSPKRVLYTREFEMIWLAWPKNRRGNSDKRKAFERYKAGVEQFGADAVAAAAKRYLSLPETRKEQWRYCCLVEVFMNGKLEAAVEAARETDAAPDTISHEDARRQAAQAYYDKTGRWPPGHKPSTEVRPS